MSGRNFPFRPALGGRNRHLLKNVSILSGNLSIDLCYYVSKNLSVKPLSSIWIISVFITICSLEICSVCRESWHDYSPKMFGSFSPLLLCCRKKIKMLFNNLGRSVLRKTVPSVLSIQDLGHSFSQYGLLVK